MKECFVLLLNHGRYLNGSSVLQNPVMHTFVHLFYGSYNSSFQSFSCLIYEPLRQHLLRIPIKRNSRGEVTWPLVPMGLGHHIHSIW